LPDTEQPTPPAEGAEPEAPPAEGVSESTTTSQPAPVSQEDFKAFAGNIVDTLKTMQGGFNALAANAQAGNQTQGPVEAPIDDASDDEIQAAIEAGDGKRAAALSRKAARAEAERMRRQMQRESIDPLLLHGMGSVAQLAWRAAKSEMPYYDKYKPEVDAMIASRLRPEDKLNPDNIVTAYNLVVAKHLPEIEAAAAEKAIRQFRESGGVPRGGATGRENAAPAIPGVADALGGERGRLAEESMAALGRDKDDFARKLGYRGGWAEYYEKRIRGNA